MMESIEEEVESTARNYNIGYLYWLTKAKANGASRQKHVWEAVNEWRGNLERWREHFEDVLNVGSVGTELPDDTGALSAQ